MSQKHYETVRDGRGRYRSLTSRGHADWMRDYNPDGWDDATWGAFIQRCSTDAAFKNRCQRAKAAGRARPHPLDGGWVPNKDIDPLEAILGSQRARTHGDPRGER
jgi:hypothetical protein